jgi:hemerythrin-like domain-containing protein
VPRIIDRLRSEHLNLDRLVRLLDRQPSLLASTATPNIGLLVDVLFYLTRFPDVTHHPLEDRIVERLRDRNALSEEFAEEIEAQHVTLARQGSDLLRDLESSLREETMSPELVEPNILLYAERLRHNMKVEELVLFPTAVRQLDDEDWYAIERSVNLIGSDPLFQTPVESRFNQLHQVIALEACCDCNT